jgi:sigma-B regulation protein RsbU (phosphoserine phosphatase)
MATPATDMRAQLLDRRQRLVGVVETGMAAAGIEGLLSEVDDALERLANGTYGLCETCHESIESDRLQADPLLRFCIDHLTPNEARALEDDLDLAARVQQTLLPSSSLVDRGWEMAYQYHPLGAVSGDYCDAVTSNESDEGLVLLLGDISGKGVAASMLMAHLHASMRTLVGFNLPLPQLVQRANRVFCDSTMSNHYATLVCARLSASGAVEICNAGHCPPLLLHRGAIVPIEATGVPIGMFCTKEYGLKVHALDPGDTLLLYTDGVTDTRNATDEEYGEERVASLVASLATETPQAMVSACVADVARFRGRAKRLDDLTVMAVRRQA